MRLHVHSDEEVTTFSVALHPHALVTDLTQALGLDPDGAVVIDGVVHLPDQHLHEIAFVDGSLVTTLQNQSRNRSGLGKMWVGVVGGIDAGTVRRMDAVGTVRIGRGVFNDLRLDNDSISADHATVEASNNGSLTVEDLGSHNGTWLRGKAIKKRSSVALDEPFRIGSSSLVGRDIETGDQPAGLGVRHADHDGKILVNRPPRGPVPGPPSSIELPDRPAEQSNPTLTAVTLLLPLVFAAVMVVALGSWRYAVFGLLSPAMAVGNWVSNRRRVARENAGDAKTHREALASLRRELADVAAEERFRRSNVGPDLLEIRRRLELPSSKLWERRRNADDAFVIRLGIGNSRFQPETTFAGEKLPSDVASILDDFTGLKSTEILADLRMGPMGLVGDAQRGAAVCRSLLLQIATHHGPADCRIAILTSVENVEAWRWAQWLPHTAMTNEGVHILTGESATTFASSLREATDEQHSSGWLIVVDDVSLLHQRQSPIRQVLERAERGVFGIVLARSSDQLPASIASVVTFESNDGEFTLTIPAAPGHDESGILDSTSVDVAEDLARSMARFEDPEQEQQGGVLPRSVDAAEIYGELDSLAIQKRWMLSKRDIALKIPVGISEAGLVHLDLVLDGPHCLVAGTTGSGKSEFLRTLILGLATHHDPDDLVFVLIDYKGGSAFDRCAALPHVVGMVTDLDDQLGERALTSLDAELHRREQTLRDAGSKDIIDYREAGSVGGALPRLVVVIDEFATLRSELPSFVSSLVAIAQRGRSLGVHLVLATQRPSGAVDANIRANTNLRVALRVQDSGDSMDVIDSKLAAEIPRTLPGRAYIRRGEGDLISVQTAYVSGASENSVPTIRVAEVHVGSGQSPAFLPDQIAAQGSTDLEHMVEIVTRASRLIETPRKPWLPDVSRDLTQQLPEDYRSLEIVDDPTVVIAIGDDPVRQRHVRRGWNTRDGHLAVVGVLGSGVTTTLRSTIAALGHVDPARPVWVFPVDHGTGGLAGLEDYPHVGTVIHAGDQARHERLLQFLAGHLDSRRASSEDPRSHPLIVVAIDGIASFAAERMMTEKPEDIERWERIGRDGPAVGIVLLLGATRASDIPRQLRGSVRQHIVLEQPDPLAYGDLGIRSTHLPRFSPGRALMGNDEMAVQVIDWDSLMTPSQCVQRPNVPVIEALPEVIERSVIHDSNVLLDPVLAVPVGIDDVTRHVARLSVRTGDHAIVSGPSRSGRTSALRLIASQLRAADPQLILVGIAPASSADLFDEQVFDAGGTPEGLTHVLTTALTDDRRWVILVDDADRIELESGPLVELAKNAPVNVTLIVGLRSSVARQAYGHWSRFIRGSGTGILLNPDNSVDGELLGVRLPRHDRLGDVPGRGYIVTNGDVHLVQLAK